MKPALDPIQDYAWSESALLTLVKDFEKFLDLSYVVSRSHSWMLTLVKMLFYEFKIIFQSSKNAWWYGGLYYTSNLYKNKQQNTQN